MQRRSTRAEQWRRKADQGPPKLHRTYTERSKSPLIILVFLAPMILLYEIGSVLYLSPAHLDGDQTAVKDIKAHKLLSDLFDLLGTGGIVLPAFLLVAILVIQHVLRRERVRISPQTLLLMWLEAIIWTIPLIVLGQLLFRLLGGDSVPIAAAAPAQHPTETLNSLSIGARGTIALGAGLYEEFVFRMIGIALLHAILHDALRVKNRIAAVLALIVTSLLFAWYHAPTEGMISAHAGFYTAAGMFFGFLYLTRGLGIAVAVHVLYDLAVLILLAH